MYDEDSFFTLTMGEGAAVLALGLVMVLMCFSCVYRFTRGRSFILRLAIALGVFTLFVWLSPQAYYALYMVFFDLPFQIVTGWPPTPLRLAGLLMFTQTANLSFHAQGLLGWVLIGAGVLRPFYALPFFK